MNDSYNTIADLAKRIANLSAEKYQLLDCLLKQENKAIGTNSNIVYDYYNALSNQGSWLDYTSQEIQYDQTFLTFGPFPEIVPGFSWILTGAYPENYHQYLPLVLKSQQEMRQVLFSQVNFSQCQKVLDFGCGYGSDLIELAQQYEHLELCGYTISSEQAKVASRKVAGYQLQDRVKIFNRNSAEDDFPNEYDVIFGLEVAHHIKNKKLLFSNISRHLNENGFLILADFISNQSFAIEHELTSSYFIPPKEWIELLVNHQLILTDAIDISQEIANFLFDENFEENLNLLDKNKQNESIKDAFTSYHQLGKLLRQKLASYVLLTARKQSHLSLDKLAQLNQQRLENLTPYAERSPAQGLYEMVWQPLALKQLDFLATSSNPGCWLIFTDTQAVGQTLIELLQEQGDRCIQVMARPTYQQISANCYAVNPLEPQDFQTLLKDITQHGELPERGIVHLWSLETTSRLEPSLASLQEAQVKGCGSVLHLIQALDSVGWSHHPRLWLITQGAIATQTTDKEIQVQQAPLWGLGRTILLEYPQSKCTCLDWDSSSDRTTIQRLAQELMVAENEQQIAWRGSTRYVARLVRHSQPSMTSEPSVIQTNGSYLITGGLGALGLKLADWLVQQGARSVILTGRQPATTTARATIEQLEKAGARVLVVSADIANSQEVAQLLETIRLSLPPLRGIIQAAGVLDDGTLRQLSWQRFSQVMSAKVQGSWHLHQQTQDLSLDFFVCFSSMTALLGKAGQANYAAANAFMDSLAHYRRILGLTGLSVNWGPWTEGGMAAQLDEQIASRFAAQGIGSIMPKQGLQLLSELLAEKTPQVGVMPICWSKFLQQFPVEQYPSVFSEIAQSIWKPTPSEVAIDSITPAALKQQLQQAAPQEREKLLSFYLQSLLAKFLGFSPTKTLNFNQTLNELGLDSLVTIQVRNRIRSELELDLSMTDLSGEASLAQLVQNLQNQLLLKQLIDLEVSASAGNDNEENEAVEEFTL